MSKRDSPSDYSFIAPFYDLIFDLPLSEGHQRIGELLSDEALHHPSLRILEIGVGSGLILNRLPAGVNYTGIDVNEKMLSLARNKAKSKNLEKRVRLLNMDAENLSFENESFDLVIAPSVLSAMGNPEKAFHEMIRVTRPGGKIGIVVNLRDKGLRSKLVLPFDRLTRKFLGFRLDLTRRDLLDKSIELIEDKNVNQVLGFPFSTFLLFRKK